MNQSIKQELKQHLIETVLNTDNDRTDYDDIHFEAFNEAYYIIGYYQASEWLKAHNVDPFKAIAYVIEQENNHFGESNLKPDDINSEKIVNLLVYFAGFDVMPNCDLSNITKNDLLALLNDDSEAA
jgi:hypothetical protein